MIQNPLNQKGYVTGYWDGVKDAISGNVKDCQTSGIANLPIKAMALSSRAYNCLVQCGCVHVKDVVSLNSDAILKMRNLGPKTASEIACWLIEQGILSSAWTEYI